LIGSLSQNNLSKGDQTPPCPVYGECGGCSYQDISYQQELKIKEGLVRDLFSVNDLEVSKKFQSIIESPQHYHYRNRLDLKFIQTKNNDILIGFTPQDGRGIVTVDQCPIAIESISAFIPKLKTEVLQKLKIKQYRRANLVVRTGDDGRVFWGGMGRKSNRLLPDQYFWTEIHGRKIYYSLETFFQANLSILPVFFKYLAQLNIWKDDTNFYDLYGGVGLFSVGLYDYFHKGILIEECKRSIEIAHHNVEANSLDKVMICEGKVEDHLKDLLEQDDAHHVAMIDPPRSGLSEKARELISQLTSLDHLLYLSCNPETLVRDLRSFCGHNWKIETVVPFDFFPRTRHVETLCMLSRIN